MGPQLAVRLTCDGVETGPSRTSTGFSAVAYVAPRVLRGLPAKLVAGLVAELHCAQRLPLCASKSYCALRLEGIQALPSLSVEIQDSSLVQVLPLSIALQGIQSPSFRSTNLARARDSFNQPINGLCYHKPNI